MALLALRCPSCGANLELDDSREFAFCTYCGTKIMIQDEIRRVDVVHSGSVKIDESSKMKNYLTLAYQAYSCGNYIEAYKYYSFALECNTQMPDALVRKGICAAYLSSLIDNRISEANLGVRTAAQIMAKSPEKRQLKIELFREIVDFVKAFFEREKMRGGCYFKNITAAEGYFDVFRSICILCINALDFLDNNTTAAFAGVENEKKEFIKLGIKIARVTVQTVPYQTGTQTVIDKNGNVIRKPILKKLKPMYLDDFNQYVSDLKLRYNNLPGTVMGIKGYDKELQRLQDVISDYNIALRQYLAANPGDEKAYFHPPVFGAKKKLAEIEARFPQELKDRKTLALKAKKDLAATEKARAAFINKNTKK